MEMFHLCTHSDDCEISEIMQDHEDVALEKPGRWERMISLRDSISLLARSLQEIEDEKDDLKEELEELHKSMNDVKRKLSELNADNKGYGDLNVSLESMCRGEEMLRDKISTLEKHQIESPLRREEERKQFHAELKILAAEVRNEFSKKSLQVDFQKGIEDLVCKPSEKADQVPDQQESKMKNVPVLPANFRLEVFWTSSNEYLKLQGVKVGSDGTAACFNSPEQTGISEVMKSVHKATAEHRVDHTKNFLMVSGNILGRVYFYASGCKVDYEASKLLSQAFNTRVEGIGPAVKQIVVKFDGEMKKLIHKDLEPSLRMAATKGDTDGMNVVMEAYPDLKANQNMMQVSEELITTENKVGFARQAFNDQVMAYNTYKQSFPQTLFAAAFGHAADASLLEFEDSAQIQAAPKVSF